MGSGEKKRRREVERSGQWACSTETENERMPGVRRLFAIADSVLRANVDSQSRSLPSSLPLPC